MNFPEELERENYLEAVADKYRIGFDHLRKLVGSLAAQDGLIRHPAPLKSGIHENKKKEDGMKTSQKLLLTWLIEEPRLYEKIRAWISADDFTEELYRKAAALLFEQFEAGQGVNPAKIVSYFEDEEEQKEAAGLFNAAIREVETKDDREKALKETLVRVKRNSIERRSREDDPADMDAMMRLIEDRRALEQLEKLHISID